MAVEPTINSTCLDLSISVPGLASSSSGLMRNLDINQVPSTDHEEDQWTTASFEDEEDNINNNNNSGPPRKKLRLTKEQSLFLEESFKQNHTLNPKQKEALAMHLRLKPRQVEVWFQNRRARSKLKQTEMECEYLKRWYGSLTEQNRRLHKEVEELRAMRVAPPTVISPHGCEPLPASALTMCPRCERVTATTSLDSAGPAAAARVAASNHTVMSAKVPIFNRRHPSAAW
ncbi:homeobox-leucine zipper protein HOX3 isoform X2 [Diospyros lotus]|uniref:homeobox-leucine zipper protein HOX3 isoform X2 n=1 Tax=Diospyros lotus TaxID=55363 RepID=UPI0022555EBA|nr:homeobox-leucine zipper protein HOX3 isoform X2 [Diospyros lotus]